MPLPQFFRQVWYSGYVRRQRRCGARLDAVLSSVSAKAAIKPPFRWYRIAVAIGATGGGVLLPRLYDMNALKIVLFLQEGSWFFLRSGFLPGRFLSFLGGIFPVCWDPRIAVFATFSISAFSVTERWSAKRREKGGVRSHTETQARI